VLEQNAIKVSQGDLTEDRFDRFRLIKWWNQDKIAAARVLVVGAGALGNELVKNLALLGFRQILIVDLDQIECSNLSRSVLFRPNDIGKSKAETAAQSAMAIFPEAKVHHMDANILHEVGLGVFKWTDVILAGLDNREARLWINRCAWKTNRPWVDGAIEGINGVARVFIPGHPPCYECTLGETDWAILEKRMSCNLLSRDEMVNGKVPTTPTMSSIIAGVQVQEAVKLLHGLPVLAGKGLVFEGLNHTSYVVEYTANTECMSHETYDNFATWKRKSSEATVHDLFEFAQDRLGAKEITLEFSREVIQKFVCPNCKQEEAVYLPVGKVGSARGKCPHDSASREVVAMHSYTGREEYGAKKLSDLGVPLFDVFVGRSGNGEVQILLEGDAPEVLGPLATERAELRQNENQESCL
jgi:adenylyltransferase/sulfurtransferase